MKILNIFKNKIISVLRVFRIKWISIILFVTTFITVKISGDNNFQKRLNNKIVNDVTKLNPIQVAQVIQPKTEEDIVKAIKNTTGKVSIGGGRYSQGGQVAYENSIHLDMRQYNKVLDFQPDKKEITVQSGITWRDIQEIIDPKNLSIKIMQTYANFTVGGSLSVNVHGRYIGEGPLILSVKSFKIVLADGSVKKATPDKNKELFYGAIGGYGGLGVISEATLFLTDNTKVERRTKSMPITEYKNYFFDKIRENKNVVFHNADIYPPDYEKVLDVSWYKTNKELTHTDRLIAKDRKYPLQPYLVDIVSGSDFGKWLRKSVFDPYYYSKERVVWRNWEASYDVRELEPSDRDDYTYVLREYFVPVEKFDDFYPKMKKIFLDNDVNIINVSIRHAKPDSGTLLAWARKEVFAFVVYYRQGTDNKAKEKVKKWTQEIVDAVTDMGGTYYLPYQIYASEEQFQKAYPKSSDFFALKDKVDPKNRFINKLWDAYYPKNKGVLKAKAKSIPQYFRGEEQTILTIPEWYLVFNPKEYADFLEAKNNPSDFPFLESINEYWSLYDRVMILTEMAYPVNKEYRTMLQVIGVSTTLEYLLKSFYENTFGRLSYWISGPTKEDQIIAEAHRAYSDFIYHTAWYEFNFWHWVKKLWANTNFLESGFIRKTERKLFFSMEFVVKTIYAKLIGFGAKTAYEASDGLIYAKVKADDRNIIEFDPRIQVLATEDNNHLIGIPRWGPFTELVPILAAQKINFLEISGNDEIALSFLTNKSTKVTLPNANLLFESKVVSDKDKTRLVFLVKVSELSNQLQRIKNQYGNIEHIYDY